MLSRKVVPKVAPRYFEGPSHEPQTQWFSREFARRFASRAVGFRNWSIGRRLMLIVTAIAIPLNAVIVAVILVLAADANQAQRTALLYTAHSVAAGVDAKLSKYLAIAEDLKHSPFLAANDVAAFDTEARQTLTGIADAWVIVADLHGKELVNTSIAHGTALPMRSADGITAQQQALKSGAAYVSPVHMNGTGEWVASVEAPVLIGGKPVYSLAVVMNLPGFARLLSAQEIPHGWLTGIVDQEGRFIVRVPDKGQHVGQLASEGYRAAMGKEGMFEFQSLEGNPLVQANAVTAVGGWTVGIAELKQELLAASLRAVMWAIVLGFVLTALGLAFALLVGRSITEPINALRTNAGTLFDGTPSAIDPGPPEVGELWGTLAGAYEASRKSRDELQRVSDRLAAVVTSSTDAIVSKTLDGTVASWNKSAERLFGFSDEEMIGQSINRLIPPDKLKEEGEIMARLQAGELVRQYDTARITKDGRVIDVSVSISPILDEAGRLCGISKIDRDITELKVNQRKLFESERRQKQILDTVNAFVGLLDDRGCIIEVNARAAEVAGCTPEAMIGMHMADAPWWRFSSEVSQRMREIVNRCIAGETVRCDLKYVSAGGEIRWVDFQAAPIVSDQNLITAVVPSGVDVTERKRAEEQVRTLMMEVNHRSKNMLGLVLSIARQTSARNFPEFMTRFSERVFALSANLDLLVRNDWYGIDLDDLGKAQLAPLVGSTIERVLLTGPKLRLTAAAAQAVGMALHELATNAVKYGALSNKNGHVELAWRLADGDLELTWREIGGPAVTAPSSRGFGSSIMTTLAETGVGGKADIQYNADGVVWSLRCPASGVLEKSVILS